MDQTPPDAGALTSAMGYLEYRLLPLDRALMPGEMPKVLDYWDRLRGDRFAPTWAEFKLYDLPPSLLPMTVVVDVLGGGDPAAARYVYRFWGTRRAELMGRENMGREVRDALPDRSGPIIAEQYGLAVTARAPLLFRNLYPFKPAEAAVCITFRLPVAAADGQAVDKIVTCAIMDNPKAYAEFASASNPPPANRP